MENRSGLGQAQDQAEMRATRINPDLLEWVGRWVANPSLYGPRVE